MLQRLPFATPPLPQKMSPSASSSFVQAVTTATSRLWMPDSVSSMDVMTEAQQQKSWLPKKWMRLGMQTSECNEKTWLPEAVSEPCSEIYSFGEQFVKGYERTINSPARPRDTNTSPKHPPTLEGGCFHHRSNHTTLTAGRTIRNAVGSG
jgi:hypothetical protein